MSGSDTPKRLRSRDWFDDPERIDMSALYLERFMNSGITPEELTSGKPIVAIAQTGSDINPCNRIHLALAERVRDGIRDAGGIPMVFPVHPTFENCRRPTAALDRNLAYLGLTEILYGYPLDGVVLMTGCDKSTPACLMAALTVDLPAIVLSGGPMLDGWHEGERVGSGTVIWRARRALAAGEIDEAGFLEQAMASAPSLGHCNTMGTALTMNAVAEGLGMALPGCAAIPAPYRERGQVAYRTGRRIVEMISEDLKPSDVITEASISNAIALIAALGGSTNAQPHLTAIARHAGLELSAERWMTCGYNVPLLANVQPAGAYLGESFHRAGGVPTVMAELVAHGYADGTVKTVCGTTMVKALENARPPDGEVIHSCAEPLAERAGFLVLSGNLFDFAIMKTSVISSEFRARYLERPDAPGRVELKAVVFDGAEDYHDRINDPDLSVDENTILVIRGCGPVGWPGSAEVVNMQPPDRLIARGIRSLPTLGDGRQSGTSDSPSILNASPESALGGGLALVRTGDTICIDVQKATCNLMVDTAELERRRGEPIPPIPESQTPWQAIYRSNVGQLSGGAVIEEAVGYRRVARKTPRHNH